MPRRSLTRSRLLRMGAAGAAAAWSSTLVSPLAAFAASDEDLALLRLAASAELLANSFYYRALHGTALNAGDRRVVRSARDADRRHYVVLARAIGPDAPAFADFEIAFPARTFTDRRRLLRVGQDMKRALLGVHLHAAGAVTDAAHRAVVARIAANEASQLAALSALAGGSPLVAALPEPLDEERASELLAPYRGGG